MKRIHQLAGIVALVAAPALLHAQNAKPFSLGVSAGLSAPMGDLADAVKSGYTVAGHVYFKPASLKMLGFRGDVSFDNWDSKIASNSSSRSLAVVANAQYMFNNSGSMFLPYVIGGAGGYNYKGSSGNLSSSFTKPGLQAGGGVEFQLAGFSTFVEAKFVNIFADGGSINWVPVTFGVKF